jgi:aminoglycoside phosphotransferase (APT) family kinase protein
VVRVPRRAEGAVCLRDELAWLPRLAPHLPVRVPVSDVVVPGDDAFEWPIAGYPMIAGVTADRTAGDGLDDARVARRIAAALHALHRLDLDDDHGAPGDRMRKGDLAFRMRDIEVRARDLVERGEIPAEVGRRCVAAAAAWAGVHEVTLAEARWVHGDLHPRHIVIDGGRLSGIIDWGDLHRGDPAVDVSLAWTLLGARARAAFLGELTPDPDLEVRARLRALFYGLVFVGYGRDIGDHDFLRTGHRTLAALDIT